MHDSSHASEVPQNNFTAGHASTYVTIAALAVTPKRRDTRTTLLAMTKKDVCPIHLKPSHEQTTIALTL